jgi:hypothetical protein
LGLNKVPTLRSEASQSVLSQLDGNQTTQADVVLQLADTAQNKLNIDLVGIQLHGFEFVS